MLRGSSAIWTVASCRASRLLYLAKFYKQSCLHLAWSPRCSCRSDLTNSKSESPKESIIIKRTKHLVRQTYRSHLGDQSLERSRDETCEGDPSSLDWRCTAGIRKPTAINSWLIDDFVARHTYHCASWCHNTAQYTVDVQSVLCEALYNDVASAPRLAFTAPRLPRYIWHVI